MSKKYLDSKGLSYLWQKVCDKYIQKQSIPTVENELIYFDTEDGFISNQLLLQDDVLFVNTQEDYNLCTKTECIESDVLGSWQQFQCNTNNTSDKANDGKYNTSISPEYGKGVLGNTTKSTHPSSGYGWWYNDGTNIKNDINSGDFNGYIMPFNKNKYSFDTLFGCYSNKSTSGDQIGFSIVNDKNALPRRVETTDGTYYRNTLYDKVSVDNNDFKHPSQSAWVKEDKINNTAKVIFTAGPIEKGEEESFPTIDSNFTVYDVENIRTSVGRKNPIKSTTTVKITSTHEATGYLGLLTVVITNSTGIELTQGDSTSYVSNDTGTIYVFGSVFDIKTKKWNSTKIIDGSVNADGNYWKLGKNLVEYNAAYNGNDANKTCIIRCNAAYNDGKLEISFGDPVSYVNRDSADFNGSKLSFDFKNKTYSFESYHENGSPIHEIKHDINLSNFTPTVHINETQKRLSNDEFWNLFTGDTKFMYNAYSYGYLYIKVLNMITDGKVIFIHEDNTNTEYELNEKRTEYISKGNIQTKDILTGSRLAYNPITKKLFYSNGEKIYQIAGGISDKDIIDSPIGGITNEQVKYLFDSVLNSYSFGYQREITEDIKVRRLEDSEKRNLSETYGVDWNYINIDNKIQEGAKGKLYSDEVNYIDEISDIKYVDLLNGGTLFNCNSVIIPEDDYNVHEFTYKYSSGVEGTNAFAEGDATLASGNSSHAEGEWNTAYGDYSHAEGESTTAQGQSSHAEGEDTLAIGDVSHAEGSRTLAVGNYSHTEGYDTVAQNAYEHSQGVYNVSNKETETFGDKNTIFSVGIGKNDEERKNALEVLQNGDIYINNVGDYDGTNALRESNITGKIARSLQDALSDTPGYTYVKESNAFIEGENQEWLNSTPKVYKVHKLNNEEKEALYFYGSIGINYDYCIHCADNAILSIIYDDNKTNLQNAQLLRCSGCIGVDGNIIIQTPNNSNLGNIELKFFNLDLYDENDEQITLENDTDYYFSYPNVGINTHSEGSNSIASGVNSHAEGNATTASGDFSHAEGSCTVSYGAASHAECSGSIGIGAASHAEGGFTTASGDYSHSEGNTTTASGYASHAEGAAAIASGGQSHAEGYNTQAKGHQSHAEGSCTEAIGIASHAEGSYTEAIGIASHAEGMNNTAPNDAQHVSGKFATVDETGTAIFQVGIGNDPDDRKDALRIKTDGDIIIQQDNQEIVLQDKLDSLQKQIDGEISSWFFEGEPTTSNTPANEWTTDELKQRHEGDTYTNINNAINEHFNNPDFWEQGSTKDTIGNTYEQDKSAATTRLRTKELLKNNGEKITILTADWQLFIQYYNSEKKIVTTDPYATSRELNKSYPYYTIILKKSDGNATITPSMISTLSIVVGGKSDYDPTAGQSWRWCNVNDEYGDGWHWHKIADSDAVKAFAEAAKAQQLANTANTNATNALNTANTAKTTADTANTNANTVRQDFDNLEIGGRNLLTGTKDAIGWDTYGSTISNVDGKIRVDFTQKNTSSLIYMSNVNIEANKDYVLSFRAKADKEVNLNFLSVKNVRNITTTTFATITTEEHYFTHKFNKNSDISGILCLGFNPSVEASVYFDEIKLEKGNKATAWTPAPEDIQNGYTWNAEKNSFAVGKNINTASGNYSFAEGQSTTASGRYSHTEGYNTVASEESAHAEGTRTVASGETAHAEGHQTQAIGNGSHAEGAFTIAKVDCSHAEGSETTASGVTSHAEGGFTIASGDASHAEGMETTASGETAHAEGSSTNAEGDASHAEGNWSHAKGNSSHAEGVETIASGVASHAEGAKYESNRSTESAGQASHAEGASTYAKADGSHAEGILNIAGRFSDEISTAAQELGISGTPQELAAKLLGYGAHAEGMNNKALGSCSHAEGNATKALANSTHAEGDTTIAFGEASHAEGYNTQAKGNQSHAEGSSTIATGNSSHAEGFSTVASGSFSHAEGSHTEATGRDSHAEGAYNKAIGIASHTEGEYTTAQGVASHAEGYSTYANGENSHAEGRYARASGDCSHAEGVGYYEPEIQEIVIKKFANEDSDSIYELIHEYTGIDFNYFTDAEGYNNLNGAWLYAPDNTDLENTIGKIVISKYVEGYGDGDITPTSTYLKIIFYGDDVFDTLPDQNNGKLVSVVPQSGSYDDFSHSEGEFTIAQGYASHAEGNCTTASGAYSHAEGESTIAEGNYSHSEGYYNTSSGDASHTEGSSNIALGEASHAEGIGNKASGDYSHAEGNATTASGGCSHAEGSWTTASGDYSHTEGYAVAAQGYASHAEGECVVAEGYTSHAEGTSTTASGECSHAEGTSTTASGECSHTEGYSSVTGGTATTNDLTAGTSTTSGAYAHAEGNATMAKGVGSHSEGQKTFASGMYSHAEGGFTKASGITSHAEGNSTTASGPGSHAEGNGTTASGNFSHAEGNATKALGQYSHAEGASTVASGSASHAGGINCTASHANTLVFGRGLVSGTSDQTVIGKFNKSMTDLGNGVRFIIGSGSNDVARKNLVVVQDGGNTSAAGGSGGLMTWGPVKSGVSTIGDFGEYFEWLDGNPNNEDRIGYMVQLNGDKIELATAFTRCIGVISGTASFLSGACSLDWQGRFLKDKFGRYLKDENGEFIVNPDYNPDLEYTPREQRKEWDVVGLVGQVITRQDGTLTVGGHAGVKNGIATNATNGYRVLRIIDNETALLLVK